MEFKEKLKELRNNNKVSQYKLAEELNISRSVIAKWETGLVFPNDEQLTLLSNYFKVDISYFKENEKYENIFIVKNQKIFKQRKTILTLGIISIILLIILTINLISFSPRSISYYIEEDINDLMKFEIINLEDKYVFDVEKDINIINDILDTKVIPSYIFNKKQRTSYKIILCFEKSTYEIDGDSIKVDNRIYHFYEKEYSLYSVVYKYIGG